MLILGSVIFGTLFTKAMEASHEQKMSTEKGKEARKIVNAVIKAQSIEEYQELIA